MRIDRLLCYLRFARTRSAAQAMVESQQLRCNRQRITRTSHAIDVGDVLTIPKGNRVRVIEIQALPERRGSASEAAAHFQELDPAP